MHVEYNPGLPLPILPLPVRVRVEPTQSEEDSYSCTEIAKQCRPISIRPCMGYPDTPILKSVLNLAPTKFSTST